MNLELSSITHCSSEKFFEECIVPNFVLEKRHQYSEAEPKTRMAKQKIRYFLHST